MSQQPNNEAQAQTSTAAPRVLYVGIPATAKNNEEQVPVSAATGQTPRVVASGVPAAKSNEQQKAINLQIHSLYEMLSAMAPAAWMSLDNKTLNMAESVANAFIRAHEQSETFILSRKALAIKNQVDELKRAHRDGTKLPMAYIKRDQVDGNNGAVAGNDKPIGANQPNAAKADPSCSVMPPVIAIPRLFPSTSRVDPQHRVPNYDSYGQPKPSKAPKSKGASLGPMQWRLMHQPYTADYLPYSADDYCNDMDYLGFMDYLPHQRRADYPAIQTYYKRF